MPLLPQLIAWLVAVAWLARSLEALRGLPTVPNLCLPAYDIVSPGAPTITIVVPARNEEKDIQATLESLLAQDYPTQIIAVDDRSTDRTGTIMDSLACDRLKVMHVTELPPQWLGKTHAMAHAASLAGSDFLLFTDADILFAPSAIRRSLAYAVSSSADHLVLAPTAIIRRWDEAALLSFFQVFGLWAARPWKVSDPKAMRDAIGVGAFNLVRASAYRQIGGFEALRMEIVEDLGLARRIKAAGLRQRFAFGSGLVKLHWASGVGGIVNVMTKNIFSAFRFHISLLLLGCAWLALFCVMPFIAVWSKPFAVPAAIAIAAIFLAYAAIARVGTLSRWNAFFAPIAASLFLYALLRSMATTLSQGGVTWRGTFYPLAELRKHTTPFF